MLSKVEIVIYREKKEISKHKQVPINFRMKLGIFRKSHNYYFTIEVSNWLAAKASIQRWV